MLAIIKAEVEGKKAESLELLHNAATKDHHPSACIILVSEYLIENNIKKNHTLSEKFLRDALLYGLTTKQFYNNCFLISLCGCLDFLIREKIYSHFFTIIRKALEANDIDLTIFYTTFKETTGIDLSSIPEWNQQIT